MSEVSTVLGKIFLVLSWIVFLIFGIYLMYQVIKYLREKPPNTQTVLDGLYIQMFSILIYFIIVGVIVMVIVGLGIKVEMISFVAGNALNIAVFLASMNLITSCCFRIVLISNPSMVEDIPDQDIQTYSMYVYNNTLLLETY